MKKFVIRRVLLGVVILFFVSLIIYSIERSLPTSYVKEKRWRCRRNRVPSLMRSCWQI